jgi:alpha-tubulin suppressor-like RCC1 family protein
VWGSSAGSSAALGLGENVVTVNTPTLIESLSDKQVRRVFCGRSSCFTFALTAHGDMYAWGNNTSGQLGFGDCKRRSKPEKSETVSRVAHMTIGLAHVVVVNTEGLMFSWGSNSEGQLGCNTGGKNVFYPHEITQVRGKDIIQVDSTANTLIALSRSGLFPFESVLLFFQEQYMHGGIRQVN